MRRRGIAAVFIVVLASPVFAEGVLPIGGAFGNEAGCAMYETGDRSPEDLAVLTPFTFTTHSIGCYFIELDSRLDEHAVEHLQAWASCGAPGGDATRTFVAIAGNRTTGYAVAIEGHGPGWGPLALCPGLENLFAPPGVQI